MVGSHSGAFLQSRTPWRALSTRKSPFNSKGSRTSTSPPSPSQKSTHNKTHPSDPTRSKNSSAPIAAPPKRPKRSSKEFTTKPAIAKPSTKKSQPHPPVPPKNQSAVQQSIPDYKHSRTPPQQDLDSLQRLVDELLSTNSSVAKRDILAQHPAQAPLLAWIYDPLRQFYVSSSNVLKYAQLRAKQRDGNSAAASLGTSTSNLNTPPQDHTLKAAPGSNVSSRDEEALYSSMNKKQRSEALARAATLGRGYETLSALLNALSTRAISGYTALDAILLFMDRFCKDDARSSSSLSSPPSRSLAAPSTATRNHGESTQELFATPRAKLLLKILDKNLKTGCNVGLIREIYPTLIPGFHVALGHSLLNLEDARTLFPDQPPTETPAAVTTSDRDKAVQSPGNTAGGLDGTAAGWFASRKLDGVRCLVRIDRTTGGIETLSRNGRGFDSLGRVQDALRSLMRTSNGNEQKGRDIFFARAVGQGLATSQASELEGQELPDSLILDGEVCVFLKEPAVQATMAGGQGQGVLQTGSPGDDEFGREVFLKAVSVVKRGLIGDDSQGQSVDDKGDEKAIRNGQDKESLADTMELGTGSGSEATVYCLFDCLTDKEFAERSGSRPFSARIQGLTEALLQNRGRRSSAIASARGLIRVLHQTRIESFAQLEKMVAKGLERGWEGVMLRKDVGYEGKRSRNLLKIKQFQEAEFTVQEAMLGSMRLAFQGEFRERDNVLTNVVVLHRGNRVRVGSGFSVEDRIRFGKDPSLIVGKTITVQFFEESKTFANGAAAPSADGMAGMGGSSTETTSSLLSTSEATATRVGDSRREDSTDSDGDGAGAVWSLRFPTVKAIYGSGPRQL
ncbi:hypothetical protein BGZ70_007952 [Mortierella alpina]|uniref:ATP-dependent DNA ligase family profile domain-containing protein n=1 Tax=Mortierella alpina TaxID=64518 RepID=A0A9P6M264_MORAP|nr:hypothetical protein BGZ70_007952 [Mortierella alpina]